MKKERLLVLAVSICLVLALAAPMLTAGCAPTPHGERAITIYPAQATAASYVLCFGLSEMAKAEHPWLRFELQETSGIQENLMLISDPAAWENTIAGGTSLMVTEVRAGMEPYKEACDLKVLCGLFSIPLCFATLNPDIKTLEDLKGKRFGVFSLGGVYEKSLNAMLGLHGIKPDEYTLVKGSFGTFNDGLRSGTMDAVLYSFMQAKVPVPTFDELLSTDEVYFVQFTEDDVKAANEQIVYEWGFTIAPKGTHPKQLQDAPMIVYHLSLYAHSSMDEEVTYETVKFIVEHMGEFPKYHSIAKTWTREGFGVASETAEAYHPGAKKALKELGIPIVAP